MAKARTSICPICGGTDIRRSRTRGSEYPGRYLFAHKHFLCRDCNYRWGAVAFDIHEDKPTLAFWAVVVFILELLLMSAL